VLRQDGSGVGGVLVLIEDIGQSELTDATGKCAFGRLAPGTYTVLSTLGPQSMRQSGHQCARHDYPARWMIARARVLSSHTS
jgi:hypothetical protein